MAKKAKKHRPYHLLDKRKLDQLLTTVSHHTIGVVQHMKQVLKEIADKAEAPKEATD
jgi:hypothetical protein